ncbi:unnamed protein product [Cyclocybe aegerita]|uniref:Uncharacterized protein n=1 Tax=Cyclocybe aegerita TaxID=1973307 RepID=A0A8S0WTQ3_CYCAE|nr:unnamed protein product [Cyclocybe aegerita]
MSSIATARRGPDMPPNAEVVQALMRLVQQHLPGVSLAGAITVEVVHRAIDVIKKHILSILGTGFLTAAAATLLPSLLVVAVNAIGFTAAGVLKGTLAATLQSMFWGANTGGIFSGLQAFGATAAIASPAVIGIGVAFGVIGAGLLGYRWYKKRQARAIAAAASGGSDDSDDDQKTSKRQVAVRQRTSLFDLFRRRPKVD